MIRQRLKLLLPPGGCSSGALGLPPRQNRGPHLMSVSSINDPKHWLDRAKEARALAEQIADAEAKRTMLGIADDYERLAQRAQERAAGWLQSKSRWSAVAVNAIVRQALSKVPNLSSWETQSAKASGVRASWGPPYFTISSGTRPSEIIERTPRERVPFFDFDFPKRAGHPTSKIQLKPRRCCLTLASRVPAE